MAGQATVAVLDVGKTNVKLSAVTAGGAVVETLSLPNPTRPGPPWGHHDLHAISDFLFSGLRTLAGRHPLDTFVSTAHGVAGVLVGDDPDAGDGAVLPMIDYEQPLPAEVAKAYVPLCGSFLDRGSALMHGATHSARQMLWMEMAEPEAFARARWYLMLPQYWAWRLTGVAVSEVTHLGAQSHLWNVTEKRWSPIVTARGWGRLLPDIVPAWTAVGRIRPALAARHDLPDLRVLAGIHDSSANAYRYQAGGLDAAVVSTGTWIVGLAGGVPPDRLEGHPGMTLNSDVYGAPVGGALTMAGRAFSQIAGEQPHDARSTPEDVGRLLARGTLALPSFGDDDGLFPGSAGRGRVIGPPPETAGERLALAVIHAAFLTDECLRTLGAEGLVVLDGTFLRDPAFAPLVAGLRPGAPTLVSPESYGVAAGAALLAEHEARRASAPVAVTPPEPFPLDAALLAEAADRWRSLARPGEANTP